MDGVILYFTIKVKYKKWLTVYVLESGLYATPYFICLLCNKNKYMQHVTC